MRQRIGSYLPHYLSQRPQFYHPHHPYPSFHHNTYQRQPPIYVTTSPPANEDLLDLLKIGNMSMLDADDRVPDQPKCKKTGYRCQVNWDCCSHICLTRLDSKDSDSGKCGTLWIIIVIGLDYWFIIILLTIRLSHKFKYTCFGPVVVIIDFTINGRVSSLSCTAHYAYYILHIILSSSHIEHPTIILFYYRFYKLNFYQE